MKKVIAALVAFVAISASASTYVTVTDCNRGESGTLCEKITYKVRPASPVSADAQIELVPVGEAGFAPAPKVTGGWLLKLLQNLSAKAEKYGFKHNPDDSRYFFAGGN